MGYLYAAGTTKNCAGVAITLSTPTAVSKTTGFPTKTYSMAMYTTPSSTLSLLMAHYEANTVGEYDITTATYGRWAGAGSTGYTLYTGQSVSKIFVKLVGPNAIVAAPNKRFYIGAYYSIGVVSGVTSMYTALDGSISINVKNTIGFGFQKNYLYYASSNRIFRMNSKTGVTITFAGDGTAASSNSPLRFNALTSITSDCRRNSLIVGEGGSDTMRELVITKTTAPYIAGKKDSSSYNGPGPQDWDSYNLRNPVCGQIFRHEMYVCSPENNEVVTVGMDTYGSGSDVACASVTQTKTTEFKRNAVVYLGTGTQGCVAPTGSTVASQDTPVRYVTAYQYLDNGNLVFNDLLSVRGVQASSGKLLDVIGKCSSNSGSVDNANPDNVKFKWVFGMHYYNGNVYLTDKSDHKVRVYNVNSFATTTFAGTGSNAASVNKYRVSASFNTPLRLARSGQRLLFSGVATITLISLSSGYVTQLFTQNDIGDPNGIGVLRGYVYFVASSKTVVRKVPIVGSDTTNIFFGDANQAGTTSTLMSDGNDLFIDCPRRTMYISQTPSSGPNLVRELNMVSMSIDTIAGATSCSSVNRATDVVATSQCFPSSDLGGLLMSQMTAGGGYRVLLAGGNAISFKIGVPNTVEVGGECDASTVTKWITPANVKKPTKTHSLTNEKDKANTKSRTIVIPPVTTAPPTTLPPPSTTLAPVPSTTAPPIGSPPSVTPTPSSTGPSAPPTIPPLPSQTLTTAPPPSTPVSTPGPTTPQASNSTVTLPPTSTTNPPAPSSVTTPTFPPATQMVCNLDPVLGYWTGTQCEMCIKGFTLDSNCTKCMPNFYGPQCERMCDKTTCGTGNGRGGKCDPVNGTCMCSVGYQPPNCATCADEYDGPNCTSVHTIPSHNTTTNTSSNGTAGTSQPVPVCPSNITYASILNGTMWWPDTNGFTIYFTSTIHVDGTQSFDGWNCGTIFYDSVLSEIGGTDAQCTQRSSTEIAVVLGPLANIRTPRLIRLKPSVVDGSSSSLLCPLSGSGEFTLVALDIPKVLARLSVTPGSSVGPCDYVTLSAGNSLIPNPQSLNVSYQCNSASPALTSFLRSVAPRALSVTIPPNVFPSGITNCTVRLTDLDTKVSSQASIVTTKTSQQQQQLTVEMPPNMANYAYSRTLQIVAVVTSRDDSCEPSAADVMNALVYNWTITSESSPASSSVPSLMSLVTTRRYTLTIPSNTLTPNTTYLVRVNVTSYPRSGSNAVAVWKSGVTRITTTGITISAQINGPAVRSRAWDTLLKLQGSCHPLALQVSGQWGCAPISSLSTNTDSPVNSSATRVETGDGLWSIGCPPYRLAGNNLNTSVLELLPYTTVNNGTSPVESAYTVTYTCLGSNSPSSVRVSDIPPEIPAVSVTCPQGTVATARRLVLTAQVTNTDDTVSSTNASASPWRWLLTTGTSIDDAVATGITSSQPYAVFGSGFFNSDSQYTVSVTYTRPRDGRVGRAVCTFGTKTIPSRGILEVTALGSSSIRLEALGWIGGTPPLEYSFVMFAEPHDTAVPVTSFSTMTSTTITLPPAYALCGGDGVLVLGVKVRDQEESEALAYSTYAMWSPPPSSNNNGSTHTAADDALLNSTSAESLALNMVASQRCPTQPDKVANRFQSLSDGTSSTNGAMQAGLAFLSSCPGGSTSKVLDALVGSIGGESSPPMDEAQAASLMGIISNVAFGASPSDQINTTERAVRTIQAIGDSLLNDAVVGETRRVQGSGMTTACTRSEGRGTGVGGSSLQFAHPPAAKSGEDGSSTAAVTDVCGTQWTSNPLGPALANASSQLVSYTIRGNVLPSNVLITIPLRRNTSRPQCSFFNFTLRRFDTAGCNVSRVDYRRQVVICNCSHLTDFAVTEDEARPRVNKIDWGNFADTKIGAAVVLGGLSAAFFTWVLLSRGWQMKHILRLRELQERQRRHVLRLFAVEVPQCRSTLKYTSYTAMAHSFLSRAQIDLRNNVFTASNLLTAFKKRHVWLQIFFVEPESIVTLPQRVIQLSIMVMTAMFYTGLFLQTSSTAESNNVLLMSIVYTTLLTEVTNFVTDRLLRYWFESINKRPMWSARTVNLTITT